MKQKLFQCIWRKGRETRFQKCSDDVLTRLGRFYDREFLCFSAKDTLEELPRKTEEFRTKRQLA